MPINAVRTIHVGVSRRGAVHLNIYNKSPDWHIVGLVDISEEALEAARDKTGLTKAECFHSLEDAINQMKADAVVISTPPAFHGPQVDLALSAGLHVFVEKPFTYDLAEAERLIEKASEKSLCLVVCQNARYSPVATLFRDAVISGKYGRLGYVTTNHFKARGAPYPTTPHMHLWSQGVHQIDTMMAIVDRDVTEVFGNSFNPAWCDWPSESAFFSQMTFEGGIRAEYAGTSNAKSSRSILTMRAEFEHGALIYDSSVSKLEFDGKSGPETLEAPKTSPNDEVARLFHNYITTGTEPAISGRNNLKTLRVLDAIVQSGQSGRAITF